MRINVGSTNPIKVQAVRETLANYRFLKPFSLKKLEVKSGVPEQPFGWRDIQRGSRNRAKLSFQDCDYSIGIESGLVKMPLSKSRYYDTCVVSIYNGENYHDGFSQGFYIPEIIGDIAFREGFGIGRASNLVGLTKKGIGSREGLIGIFTNNRVRRKDQISSAIMMALTEIEKSDLYKIGLKNES